MKIALVGTSPIMIILAHKLSKKNEVTIFEKRSLYGGAWSLIRHKGEFINDKTNVVIPRNNREELFVKKMNKFIDKNFKIKSKLNNQFFSDSGTYKPKKIFIYDFTQLYLNLKKFFKIKKKEIKSLEIKKNKVIINQKEFFDRIYLPFFVGLDEININNKIFKIKFSKIVSKHILILSKKKLINNFYYTENLNQVFDRALVKSLKNFKSFTARVKKEYKGYGLNKIIKLAKLNIKGKKIFYKNIMKYTNSHRSVEQQKKLTKLNRIKNITVVDTAQFIKALLKLKIVQG